MINLVLGKVSFLTVFEFNSDLATIIACLLLIALTIFQFLKHIKSFKWNDSIF